VSDCKTMKCYVIFILGSAKAQPEITAVESKLVNRDNKSLFEIGGLYYDSSDCRLKATQTYKALLILNFSCTYISFL
jgi:hypothetical protein